MARDGKSAGQLHGRRYFTVVHSVQFFTTGAIKITMRISSGHLIASVSAGNLDHSEPPFFDQRPDITVHGRNSQFAEMTFCQDEGLRRREWALRLQKCFFDGLSPPKKLGLRISRQYVHLTKNISIFALTALTMPP